MKICISCLLLCNKLSQILVPSNNKYISQFLWVRNQAWLNWSLGSESDKAANCWLALDILRLDCGKIHFQAHSLSVGKPQVFTRYWLEIPAFAKWAFPKIAYSAAVGVSQLVREKARKRARWNLECFLN